MRRTAPSRALLLALSAILLPPCAPARAEQPAEQAVRRIRGARYGNPGAPPLAESAEEETAFSVTHSHGVAASLPVGESDAVVIGRVLDARPYLSNDGTAVYTEFLVVAEEVLKDGGGGTLGPSGLLVAVREGGAFPLPDGRTLRYTAAEIGLPAAGARCALFLARDEEAEDFTILRAYELRGGVALALDLDSGHDASAPPPSEMRFLDRLREAIVPPR